MTRTYSIGRVNHPSATLFGLSATIVALLAFAMPVAAQEMVIDRQLFDTSYSYSEIRHPDVTLEAIPVFSLESYAVEMTGLPGIPSCCPEFSTGSGTALSFDLAAGRHITPTIRLLGRIGLSLASGSFRSTESKIVDGGNGGVIGTIAHEIEIDRTILTIAPGIEYTLLPRLFLSGAIPIRLGVGGSFAQSERIVSPGNIRFENDRRVRMEESGSIPSLNLFGFAVEAGIGYELPINAEETMMLVPRASIRLGFGEIVTGTGWRSTDIGFGVGFRYRIDERETIISDTIITPRPPKIKEGNVTLVRVTAEDEGYLDTLGLQVVRTSTLVPLLQDIFFAEGSADIPERYRRIGTDEASRFAESQIDGEAFDVYYELLNVLGARMQQHPDAILTLTGCNTDVGVEKNNRKLSRNRATAVRDYLVETWDIAPERLEIKARDLPSRPSPKRNEDGRSENRRVELTSNDHRLLDPVRTHDTAIRPDRSVLYFEVAEPEKFASWRVVARQGSNVIMQEAGDGVPPARVPLVLASGAIVVELTDEPITFEVQLTDATGTEKVEAGEVLVERESTTRPGAESYWMVVFGYNKRTLDDESRGTIAQVDDWMSRRHGYIVELVGQTDRTGNADYNRKLSVDRATSVVDVLGDGGDKMRGVGNAILEYPNDLPEGRYYSRNVKIVTRTDEEGR